VEQGYISLGRLKTKRVKFITQSRVPCSRCLFKTTECLVQLALIRGELGINKPRRLLHEYIFLKNVIEKHIPHI
jgi:hypothetical protein